MAEPYNPMLRRRATLGGIAETTWGTSALASVTTALSKTNIYNAKIELLPVYSQGKRRTMSPYGGGLTSRAGKKLARLTFQQELCYSDALSTLLGGCGMATALGASTFETALTNHKTFSFKLWRDGRVEQIIGAAGNAVFEFETGKPVMVNWTWDGLWAGLGTDASVPADSLSDELPFVALGASLTLGAAVIPRFEKMTLDLGVQVQPITSMTSSYGAAYFMAVDRTVTVNIDPEARKKADYDVFSKVTTETEVALALTLTDAIGDTFDVDCPKLQYIGVQQQEREEVHVDAISFEANRSAGDDEVTLTKTVHP